MELKDIRSEKELTQQKASELLGISLRSYKSYETVLEKKQTRKYLYLCECLAQYNKIDEENGILTIEKIKTIVSIVFENYDINFCYLFGSYAKNKAKGDSDIDLIIDSKITGLDFYGLVEDLRTSLHKKIDLLKINQLLDNEELLRDVLKEGIKIYG